MATAALRYDPWVEAAVLSHYGIDLLAEGTSLRRVRLLVDSLPAEAWPRHLMAEAAPPAPTPEQRRSTWERLAGMVGG